MLFRSHAAVGADPAAEVPGHDAGAAADVEHAIARPDAGEAKERLPQATLVRLGAPKLQEPGEDERVRLGVDRAVGIGRRTGQDGALNLAAQAGLQK